jgi:nucleoside-diphosphate-sugar epimerase
MNSQNILAAGGSGYIGSVLCRALLEAGHKVTVLDSFFYPMNSLALSSAHTDSDVVRGDCRNERLLTDLVPDVDLVIPLAALVGAPLSQRDATSVAPCNLQTPSFEDAVA